MSGYRFCRTDDIPRLVEAHNLCWGAHFPEDPPLTVETFKREVREQNLWASSSMLAFSGEQTVGVLLGAKRDDANLVYRIAILPELVRRGHGRHLLESLCRKVAILGPARLLAEVPAAAAGARLFFERCGFRERGRRVDFVATGAPPASASAARLVSPISVAELDEAGALGGSERPWHRSTQTLRNLGASVEGLAVASDVRIEAYLLHRSRDGAREILAIGGSRPEVLHPLVARLYELAGGSPMMAKVSENEIPFAILEGLGFRAVAEHVAYEASLSDS